MKTKRKVTILALLALMVVAVVAAGVVPAFGAEGYSADYNGNGALFYNRSETDVTGAINAKIDAVNTRLEELSTGKATEADKVAAFKEAITNGENLIYSTENASSGATTLKNEGIVTKADNRRDGFKEWEGMMFYELKYVYGGYNVDEWDGGLTLISYDAVGNKAYFVTAVFAQMVYKTHQDTRKFGPAIGDHFKATDGKWYQNFAGGYIKADSLSSTTGVSFKAKENVNKEGVVSPITNGNATGLAGGTKKDDISKIPNGLSKNEFTKLFRDTYAEFVADSFNIGSPFGPVKFGDGDKYKFTAQEFLNGDSTAAPWGDARKNWAYLAYNAEYNKVYLIKDKFMEVFERGQGGSSRHDIGEPTSNDFAITSSGTTTYYQNFSNGYLSTNGTANCTIVVGKNVNTETGNIYDVDAMTKLGVVSGLVSLEGITSNQLSAMVVECYNDAIEKFGYTSMIPSSIVSSIDGMIQQVYTAVSDSDSGTVRIVYNPETGNVYFMNIASVKAYNSQLGLPNTEIMQVANGSDDYPAIRVQGFENGYIKLVVTTQIDDNWEEIQIEIGYRTIGASYNTTYKYFEPINYSAIENTRVGKIVAATNGNDHVVTDAHSNWNIPDGATITQKFIDAYNEFFAKGFSAGEPSGDVVFWMTGNSGVIKQTFKGGNGTANFWTDNSVLMYDVYANKVRLVTDEIANGYTQGASGNGFPITDMMLDTSTGDIYQNFVCWDAPSNGYPEGQKRFTVIKFTKSTNIVTVDQSLTSMEEFNDFSDAKFVPWLDQYGSEDVTFTFTPKAKYNIGEAITIDLKSSSIITNNSNYTIIYDEVNVSKGTFSNGVWTYTGTAAEQFEIELTMYTAFSKITFKTTINIAAEGSSNGDGNTDGDTDGNTKGCKKNNIDMFALFSILGVALIALKKKI